MFKRIKGIASYPNLRAAIVIFLSVGIILTPHAGANLTDTLPKDQVTYNSLSLSNLDSHQFVPDARKENRMHPAMGHVASSSAQDLSAEKIKDLLSQNVTRRSAGKATTPQMDNLRALMGDNEDRVDARVIFDTDNGTPRMIKIQGLSTVRRSANTVRQALSIDAADQFLVSNRDLLKIKAPGEEFNVKKKWTDHLGAHHVRYQQQYKGLPVWGKEVMVHMDGSNQVYMFQGNYEPTAASVEEDFELNEQQAVNKVYDHLGVTKPVTGDIQSIERVWYTRKNGQLTAAYAIDVQLDLMNQWVYFVDANVGSVLHRISRVTQEVISSNGSDLKGDTRAFNAWRRDDGSDVLLDPTIPLNDAPHAPIPMRNSGDTYLFDLRNQVSAENLYYFSGPQWDPAAVSMAHNIKIIDDYWKSTFNRNGIDDKHMNNIMLAHFGEKMNNAGWNGQVMVFGDGDDQLFSNLAGSLDVTAHEYAHGVVEFTAGLIYENQSGALNEAFADIFGCMVDRDDWTMGEDITLKAPFHLRSLSNPADGLDPLPTKMSEYENMPVDEDHGGVHINCGIPARAAYLLAEGLSAENSGTSIGREKTEQIFYHALRYYLTQTSQFTDAREATIQSAQDLYGAEEAASVQAAWDVVEVVGGQTPDKPTPTDPVTGDDIMVYLKPVDSSGEAFDIYKQEIPTPFEGYEASQETGPLNQYVSAGNRPLSVYTAEGETWIFYVGTDHNLYAIRPDGSQQPMTFLGDIRSAAFSPDGKYFVYTREDNTDHNLYVTNLETLDIKAYELASLDTSPGGDGISNTIMYADSLSFDYTSSTLVFDAFNKMTVGSGEDEYTYWSIGCLDLNTGQFSWPFPSQNPNYDIGNARFASNNSFVIVLDIIDYTTDPATSTVQTLDLSTQTVKTVGTPNPDHLTGYNGPLLGVPSFWGNDDAVTMLIHDSVNGSVAHRVPLNDWEGSPGDAMILNDNNIARPIMHRVGERNLIAQMDLDKSTCNFAGSDASQEVVITNAGNRDIRIYNIAITGQGADAFRHDGVNGLIPRQQSKSIQVFFEPGPEASGAQAATLVVHSDADTPTMEISLTGDADAKPTGPTNNDGGNSGNSGGGGGGGGGGCFISAAMP